MQTALALDCGRRLNPNGICLEGQSDSLTFDECVAISWQTAHFLDAQNVPDGSAIAILSINDPWPVLLTIACSRIALRYVSLNYRNAAPDHASVLDRAKVTHLFYHSSLRAIAQEAREKSSEKPVLICFDEDGEQPSLRTLVKKFATTPSGLKVRSDPVVRIMVTGGTTGAPKLAAIGDDAMAASFASVMMALRDLPHQPTHLAIAPISHAAASFISPVMALGGTNVLKQLSGVEAILDEISRSRASIVFMPPTLLYMLLALQLQPDHDFTSLRYLLLAGAPAAAARIREAVARFGPVVGQFYAQSECLTMISFMAPSEIVVADQIVEHRLESCGRPTLLLDVAILDEEGKPVSKSNAGEIHVRGPQTMLGYLEPDGTLPSIDRRRWHATGDVGWFDEEGFLYIVDRKRDLIITGGFNVFPSEVEGTIHQLGAVADCAVIGVPDEKWGEAVKAVVELRPGCSLEAQEVLEHCRSALGPIKSPKSVDFVDTLPRSAVGKVVRRLVRDRYWPDNRRVR